MQDCTVLSRAVDLSEFGSPMQCQCTCNWTAPEAHGNTGPSDICRLLWNWKSSTCYISNAAAPLDHPVARKDSDRVFGAGHPLTRAHRRWRRVEWSLHLREPPQWVIYPRDARLRDSFRTRWQAVAALVWGDTGTYAYFYKSWDDTGHRGPMPGVTKQPHKCRTSSLCLPNKLSRCDAFKNAAVFTSRSCRYLIYLGWGGFGRKHKRRRSLVAKVDHFWLLKRFGYPGLCSTRRRL